jgi:hypothetical protein
MTAGDFERWLDAHLGAFPETAAWCAKHKGVVKAWRGALKHVDLEDAMQATEAMVAGELKRPYLPDDTAGAIRQHATATKRARELRTRQRHYVDGQETVACPLCLDSGWVLVWHSQTVQAARKGFLRPHRVTIGELSEDGGGRNPNRYEWGDHVLTTAVRCTCDRGSWHDGELPRYDARRHIRVTQFPPEGSHVLAAVAERKTRPASRETAFDAFGGD